METKDIEEIENFVDKIVGCFAQGTSYHRGHLRTILTNNHEVELQRGKIQALHIMEDLYHKAKDKSELIEMVNDAIWEEAKPRYFYKTY